MAFARLPLLISLLFKRSFQKFATRQMLRLPKCIASSICELAHSIPFHTWKYLNIKWNHNQQTIKFVHQMMSNETKPSNLHLQHWYCRTSLLCIMYIYYIYYIIFIFVIIAFNVSWIFKVCFTQFQVSMTMLLTVHCSGYLLN